MSGTFTKDHIRQMEWVLELERKGTKVILGLEQLSYRGATVRSCLLILRPSL